MTKTVTMAEFVNHSGKSVREQALVGRDDPRFGISEIGSPPPPLGLERRRHLHEERVDVDERDQDEQDVQADAAAEGAASPVAAAPGARGRRAHGRGRDSLLHGGRSQSCCTPFG